MAISPHPRKRRPSITMDAAFLSSSDEKLLLQSLSVLCKEISSLPPLPFLLKQNSSLLIRKTKLVSLLLEDLILNPVVPNFPPSALLCFEELYLVLERIKTLIEDCGNGSKLWLLIQQEHISNTFHEVTLDLSTLLDIFPVKEMSLNQDVVELVNLIRKQCLENHAFVHRNDANLRDEVLRILDKIRREVVPDRLELEEIFDKLRIRDSETCTDEIEVLQEEIRNQVDDKCKEKLISLFGMIRYARYVLYGESTAPTQKSKAVPRRNSSVDFNFPPDFRCPISLDLMRDPVVVSTGQTYDRTSIDLWIQSGHHTCPKTGQNLDHTELIPNRALKNLIAMWCREHKIPFDMAEVSEKADGVVVNKALLEATRMTVSYLVNKLSALQSTEMANRVVYELRALAKTDSDSRACIVEAGGLPLLVKFLSLDHPDLQVNAVTTILNLSILDANKMRIMDVDGVLNGVIEVLRSGLTWEAKGNAAATIFSLTGLHAYRKRLGRKTRVVKGLLDLARGGPTSSQRDAIMAILNLAGDREAVGKLIEGGVVEMASDMMDRMPEEGVTILEAVVKKGGLAAISAACLVIEKLAVVLRDGTERAQESAATTLVNICRKGGPDVVAELAAIPGIERVIWEVMGMGSGRGRRKAASLLRILRRWSVGLYADVSAAYSTTNVSSTTIMLPG